MANTYYHAQGVADQSRKTKHVTNISHANVAA